MPFSFSQRISSPLAPVRRWLCSLRSLWASEPELPNLYTCISANAGATQTTKSSGKETKLAAPKPINLATVELAQLILKAEQIATQSIRMDFTHAEIEWEFDEVQVPAKKEGDGPTTRKENFRPVIAAIHGTDADGIAEVWKASKIERMFPNSIKAARSNVTSIAS